MMIMESSQSPPQTKAVQNAVKLAGEAILPGASLLMEGQVAKGGAHVLAGFLATMLLGPIGLVAVIANSYSQSTTGKNVLKHFSKPETAAAPAPPAPQAPPGKG
jgi:hypothetical protein